MSSNNRLAVYPFDMEFMPVLRHKEFLDGYRITGLASPNGWGLCGKDAGYADGGSEIGILVNDRFEDLFDKCDTVMFVPHECKMDFVKNIYPKIVSAIKAKKDIICSIELPENILDEISGMCKKNEVCFKYNNKKLSKELSVQYEIITQICTPVVFVLGIGEKTHKFHIQLSLRESFLRKGYKVSQVGSRQDCELLGFHSFPDFMFKDINESKKVVMFNHYIKSIEMSERPDVIIIGIPGGIMPFNNQFTNRFGILPYTVSQAVTPDATIFSALYNDYKEEYFTVLRKSVKYKLGFDLSCFNLANLQLDLNTSKEQNRITYTNLDFGFINKRKMKYEALVTPVYNVLDRKDSVIMADYIIEKLVGYAEVESF